jgi:23S rRNA pseudouridine2605 synthase
VAASKSTGRNRPRDYRCRDGAWRPPRPEGVARVLAKAGYGSRSRAEELVTLGRVMVDGVVVTDPGHAVDRDSDILLNGEVLREAARRYLALHKPAGVTCAPTGTQRWIGHFLPPDAVGLEPVGRLDGRNRGLLLVTNDQWWRTAVTQAESLSRQYRVVVEGAVPPLALDLMRAGVSVPGQGRFRPTALQLVSADSERTVVDLTLPGAHHRAVAAAFQMLRHEVVSVVRTGLGPVRLGDLAAGAWRDLEPDEVKQLDRQRRHG